MAGPVFTQPVNLSALPPGPAALSLLHGSDYGSFPVVTEVPSVEPTHREHICRRTKLKPESSLQRGLVAQMALSFPALPEESLWPPEVGQLTRAAPVITGVICWVQSPRNLRMG